MVLNRLTSLRNKPYNVSRPVFTTHTVICSLVTKRKLMITDVTVKCLELEACLEHPERLVNNTAIHKKMGKKLTETLFSSLLRYDNGMGMNSPHTNVDLCEVKCSNILLMSVKRWPFSKNYCLVLFKQLINVKLNLNYFQFKQNKPKFKYMYTKQYIKVFNAFCF